LNPCPISQHHFYACAPVYSKLHVGLSLQPNNLDCSSSNTGKSSLINFAVTAMTDYKQLCAELVDAYAWCVDRYMSASSDDDQLIQRARAAMNTVNNEGTLQIRTWPTYKLQPKPGATADDVLAVLALLRLRVDQDVYDSLPEETRRHFTAEPS
jgi:hypothetical protein